MKKKILTMILVLTMTMSMVPMTAGAADSGDSPQAADLYESRADQTLTMQAMEIVGRSYYYADVTGLENPGEASFLADKIIKKFSDLTRIGDTSVYYLPAEGTPAGAIYGKASLSYTDYYAGDTSVEEYDAVSSATTSKNSIFPNCDSTEPVEGAGYQILGVKNVPVSTDAEIYVEAQILAASGRLPESGVYEKAAAITLNEDAEAQPAQYKTLKADGTYSALSARVAAAVDDALVSLKTTSNWGDYEIDVTETSTSHIRNSRDDNFDINSQIQGIILETSDSIKVGMRYMEEIWIQPYEVSFNLGSKAAELLVGKTVNKITYVMPDGMYIYNFKDGVYVKPQMRQESSFTAAITEDLMNVKADISGLAKDIKNPKVTVYYKEGRKTTYYVQDAALTDGEAALNMKAAPNLEYTVIISSDNYADVMESVKAPRESITDRQITLAQSSYEYDGKAKQPAVTVEGLAEGTDFTVHYSSNVKAGTAAVTVTGMGNYTGSKTVTFTITQKAKEPDSDTAPAKKKNAVITAFDVKKTTGAKAFTLAASVNSKGKLTYTSSNTKVAKVDANGKVTLVKNAVGQTVITITAAETAEYASAVRKITIQAVPKAVKKVKASSPAAKKLKVTWRKSGKGTGYEIQYSVRKSFKKAATVTGKKVTKTITKLKAKKTYYVRVRAYKKVSGTKYYSAWSAKAIAKVK